MFRAREILLTILFLASLGYLYLYPGSQALIEARTDTVMSDGTDPTTLPYMYDRVVRIWKQHPTDLLFGAVYHREGDGDRGVAYWIPQSERWLVVLYSYLFPLEQISTALVWTFLILNGLAMFLLGRYLGWNPWLSYGLSLAWAFNCYTRARAKVHMALAGIFHLPLVFLGLFLIVRGKSYRSTLGAAACFFIAATAAHYYLVTLVFLSPLFLVFVIGQPGFKKAWRTWLKRLTFALLPAIFLLAFNRFVPVPPDAQITSDQSMNNEWLQSEDMSPFLRIFHARIVDYFGGDISLGGRGDINPLREMVNDHILANLGQSNSHERTNGIRWVIWIAYLSVLGFVFFARKQRQTDVNRNILFFLVFGVFTLWMSLGPEAPTPALSPAYWLYSFDHHVRVANRAAIGFHFSVLMIVGLGLNQARFAKKIWFFPLFLTLVFVDYFPVQRMPMASVHPRYAELQREKGECGTGMLFPYVNQWNTSLEYYVFLQKMRGSDCSIINSIGSKTKAVSLINKFPPSAEYLMNVQRIPGLVEGLVQFTNCLPLSWLVFHEATPRGFAIDVCRQLGWQLHDDMTCVGPERKREMQNALNKCL